LIKVSNIKIDSFWSKLYSKVLSSRNISDLLVPTAGGASSAAPVAETAAKVEEVKGIFKYNY